MASEKAKELAAKQKAELKAAKLAKKNSNNPADWPWYRQLWQTYKVTADVDPKLNTYVIGAFVAAVVVFTVLGIFVFGSWWMGLLLGITAGITADLYILLERAKRATFVRYAGQPGSAEVALGMLDKKKWAYTAALTATRQLDVVHRVVGPPGIVLISEGQPGRVKALVSAEAKKHEQIAYGVPVLTVSMGDGEGQVPLADLQKHLTKLPKKLATAQLNDVKARLKALDAVRPRVPLPRGPMPNVKGAARAMRGR